MKHEEINDLIVISRIAGLLEGLSSLQGAQLNKTACMRMEEASERLAIYIGDQFAKDVSGREGRPNRNLAEIFPEATPDQ